MKIIYLIPSLKKSGPIEVVYNIIENLQKHEIIVIQINEDKNEVYNKERFKKLPNVKILTLFPNKSKLNLFRSKKKIKKTIDKLKPDIVHSHGFFPDVFSAFFIKGLIKVSTSHNNPYEDYTMKYNYIIAKFMVFLHFKAFKKMNKVITISDYNDRVIKKKAKTSIIYNGISDILFKELEGISKLKDRLEVPSNKKVIISVSSLIKRKNVGAILEAFDRINDENLILLIVGEGKLKNEYQEKYPSKNIHFLGHKKNIHEYLNVSDLFISVSKSEGFGLNIAEAASVGLPMILSNLKPYKEQFTKETLEDKRVSFLELNEKLVPRMSSMIIEKINNFSGVKMKKIQKKFTADFMSKEYEKQYIELTK